MSDGVTYSQGQRLSSEDAIATAVLIPQQMDLALFRDNCAHADKRMVDIFAHGKFPTEDPQKQVILLSWLEFHERAYSTNTPPPVEAFGLDVARSLDGDATCLSAGGQSGLRANHKWKFADTTYHVGEVIRIAREVYGIDLKLGRCPVCVDMDGLGAGVGDQLRQLNVWVIEFRGNATSEVDPRTYANLRCEAYATLGRRLNPDDRWKGIPWAIPASEALRQELCAPEKMYSTDGLRFSLTPKSRPPDRDDIISVREKLGRSPDEADAVVYLWHAVRLLHNLNAFFQQVAAPLAMFPQPPEQPAAGSNGNGNGNGHPQASSNPTVDWLTKMYGSLVGRDYRHPEETQQKIQQFKRELAAQRAEVEDAGLPPEQRRAAEDNWMSRVKWDGGD